MNFSGLSGGGEDACDVDLDLFLFTSTNFLGAIEDNGKWFGSIEYLEGREKVQMACEMKGMAIGVIYNALSSGVFAKAKHLRNWMVTGVRLGKGVYA